MAEIKWIKIVTDIFDDEKMLLIETLPEADSIIVIWFKLLCLAGKQNNSGVFTLNGKIPYTDKMLATIFRRKETIVDLALQTFEQFGMIEIINNTITIPNWSKHQNFDKIESKNAYMKQYMKQYREKQKLLAEGKQECKVNSKSNSKSNVSLLDKNRIDKNIKKEKKETEYDVLINNNFKDEKLKETIYEFIKMRKSIKKPLTTRGLELMIKNLNKLSTDINEQIEILNNSIMNNWLGVFPLKQSISKKQINYEEVTYTEEEYNKMMKNT